MSILTPILTWAEARLAERSTWTGLIAMAGAVGVTINPSMTNIIAAVGVALVGALHAFTPDESPAAGVAAVTEAVADATANATVQTSPNAG